MTDTRDLPLIDTTSACFKEFINFLIVNPGLATAYRTMVTTVVTLLDQQITQYQLVIAQMVMVVNVQDLLLQSYKSIADQIASQIYAVPFNSFKDCPGVSDIVKWTNQNINLYKIKIPFTEITIDINKALYEQSERKSYLAGLENANLARQKFRDELIKTLSFL